MKKLFLNLACLVVFSATALASNCASHDKVVDVLEKSFSEYRIKMGAVGSDRIMEIFESKEGNKTFSVVLTDLDGYSCVVISGHGLLDAPVINGKDT